MLYGMENKIKILCTRPVNEELVHRASEKNIEVDVLSFIKTEPVETVEVQQEIEYAITLEATIVFTSMNAVEAVSLFLEAELPNWKIYCIGNTTKQLVEKYFDHGLLAGTADNAVDLAELIVAESEGEEVIFFCGDQRRDALPAILRKNDIEVNEIIVYETFQVPHKVLKEYKGILFFSPSAVESFFKLNNIPSSVVLFAIGNTTADTIMKYCTNKIITPGAPGKDELFEEMLEYFGG